MRSVLIPDAVATTLDATPLTPSLMAFTALLTAPLPELLLSVELYVPVEALYT